MIDDWKEVERYETAKPPKDLWGLYESPVRKSTLFSLFFVRAVRAATNTGMVILICVHAFVASMTERSGGICGVSAPRDEVPFVSAKGSKTMGAQGEERERAA